MALNIRKILADVMGVEKITDADLRAELDELKLDNEVEALTREGHINADVETQSLARKMVAGKASTDEVVKLLKTAKPLPAQGREYVPPSAPAGADKDPVEAQIQAHMAEHKVPYHEAAAHVSKGGGVTKV
jgi:hypothetical protein